MKENEALRIICKTDPNENVQLWVIFICYKIYMYYRVRSHIILYIVILSLFFRIMFEGGGGHLFFQKVKKA